MLSQTVRFSSPISLVALILAVTACSSSPISEVDNSTFSEVLTEADSANPSANLSGSIKIDGSSTVYPVSKVMAEEFQKMNPGVKIAVAFSGTGGGFEKFCAGETDITDASRPINDSEAQLCKKNNIEFIELPVAFDSLSVVVNAKNTFVDCLKVSELKKMWEPAAEGRVTTWKQVRAEFPNEPLKLYGPGSDSGTYDYFTLAIVGEEGNSRKDYTASEDDEALVQGVSSNQNALGFFGYAYYIANRDRLKAVAIDNGYGCVQPSPQAVLDSSYQPLSRPIFIYVKKAAATRREVKAFTNFYLSPENAKLVLQVGYVPLPDLTLRAANSRFNRGMTGSVFEGTGSAIGLGQQELQEKEQ